jgi:leucyl aminopeptidase
MSWTPTESQKVSLVPSDNVEDLSGFDLVVVIVNDTNATSFEDFATLLDGQCEPTLNQALEQNETNKVLRFTNDNGQLKKVAILERKKLGSTLGGILKSETHVESCAVILPVDGGDIQDVTTDLLSHFYSDQRFKSSRDDKGVSKCKEIILVWTSPNENLPLEQVERAKSVADGVFLTKDIVNAPHNVLNSFALAESAQRLAKESGGRLHCKILEANDCEKRGMGAYLGVARGSETYPKFIHLTYKPKGHHKKLYVCLSSNLTNCSPILGCLRKLTSKLIKLHHFCGCQSQTWYCRKGVAF